MMKLKAEYVIPIVILIFVLIISVCSSCIKFMHGEGFDNIKNRNLAFSEFEGDGDAAVAPVGEEEPTPMGEVDYEPTPMGEVDYEPTPMGEVDYEPTPMGEVDYEPTPMGEVGYMTTPTGEFGYMTTPAGDFGYQTTFSSGYGTTPGGEYGYGTTPFSSDETPESDGEEGFATLNSVSARYGGEKPIDIYSQAHGDLSCEPNSYSNSSGYLCLDKNQKRQLMTRGMNQSGKSSQIGQA